MVLPNSFVISYILFFRFFAILQNDRILSIENLPTDRSQIFLTIYKTFYITN